MPDNKPKQQIQVEVDPNLTKTTYSNLVVVSHSRNEFVLDFAATLPGLPKAQVGNRVIMTPEHTKRLLNALFDNISKYEARFGVIETEAGPSMPFNLPPVGGQPS